VRPDHAPYERLEYIGCLAQNRAWNPGDFGYSEDQVMEGSHPELLNALLQKLIALQVLVDAINQVMTGKKERLTVD
jgi:hypothetical protein